MTWVMLVLKVGYGLPFAGLGLLARGAYVLYWYAREAFIIGWDCAGEP